MVKQGGGRTSGGVGVGGVGGSGVVQQQWEQGEEGGPVAEEGPLVLEIVVDEDVLQVCCFCCCVHTMHMDVCVVCIECVCLVCIFTHSNELVYRHHRHCIHVYIQYSLYTHTGMVDTTPFLPDHHHHHQHESYCTPRGYATHSPAT